MFAASKTASVSGGYQISRSLRFNSADSAYLTRTPASASNQRTWTWSGWVKRGSFGTNQVLFGTINSTSIFIYWDTGNSLSITDDAGTAILLTTSQVFRDPSAWYHVVFALDTTQATASNRAKLYINGTQVTAFATSTYPTQNATFGINAASAQQIGCRGTGTNLFLDGYMTEVNFIDGTQLTPSSFGETNAQTGVWQPKAYSGSYGTNGFYLNFSDNSNTTAATLGKDYSGNGNNWTPNNFSVTAGAGNDSLVDSPTSYGTDTGVGGTVRGNYATLNPLNLGANAALSNGNLDSLAGSTVYSTAKSTIGVSSGKWYVEGRLNFGGYHGIGVSNSSAALSSYIGSTTDSWGYWAQNGNKVTNASFTAYGATYTAGDIIGVALDMDAGTVTFYKNGTSQGTAFTGLTGTMFIGVTGDGSGGGSWSMNFGQRPFAYTAPSGYKALCTQNLPTPTIGATSTTLAGKYFNPVTYTGDSAFSRSITGVGFQPDFTWIKSRTGGTYYHILTDAVRGVNSQLFSNDTLAQESRTDRLTAFNSDGFSIGSYPDVNLSTGTYVAWNWKANGSGSTNTSGTITSTVSANTTSGFSVVTYTGNSTVGATVGHGLGVAPSMMFIKGRTNVDNWHVYSSALGNTGGLFLNNTNAFTVSSFFWNNTSPSSTVFTLSSGSSNNSSGVNYVAYCFAEVAGYSKFGSFVGNGSSDGPFIFTGFRPAYVMYKGSSTSGGAWDIHDAARSPRNVAVQTLFANTSGAEGGIEIDILSNGFKIRDTSANANSSGVTYIYAAFAETPQKFALAR